MRISCITPFNHPMNPFSHRLEGHSAYSAYSLQTRPAKRLIKPQPQRPLQQPFTIIILNKITRWLKSGPIICTLLLLFLLLQPIQQLRAENLTRANDKQQATNTSSKQDQLQEPVIYHKRYRHINPKTGYRTSYYKAGLPNSVPGGTRITLKEAHKHFLDQSALFLDVMAHTGTGPDPIDGNWRLSEPRENIKGSTWLADVGTGTLSDEMNDYLQTNLARLTKNNKSRLLIIYCTADCWMAWNAVQRISRLGYTNLLWFPEGSDDWKDAGYPLENAIPVPLTIKD